jgi:hypothetical protein
MTLVWRRGKRASMTPSWDEPEPTPEPPQAVKPAQVPAWTVQS